MRSRWCCHLHSMEPFVERVQVFITELLFQGRENGRFFVLYMFLEILKSILQLLINTLIDIRTVLLIELEFRTKIEEKRLHYLMKGFLKLGFLLNCLVIGFTTIIDPFECRMDNLRIKKRRNKKGTKIWSTTSSATSCWDKRSVRLLNSLCFFSMSFSSITHW